MLSFAVSTESQLSLIRAFTPILRHLSVSEIRFRYLAYSLKDTLLQPKVAQPKTIRKLRIENVEYTVADFLAQPLSKPRAELTVVMAIRLGFRLRYQERALESKTSANAHETLALPFYRTEVLLHIAAKNNLQCQFRIQTLHYSATDSIN